MTRIRATCPDCGEVDLRPIDIELHVVRSDGGDVGDGSNYRFQCPECAEAVVKPADARIARLLATGGVSVAVEHEAFDLDDQLAGLLTAIHPELPPVGAPFTADDVLAFHELLEQDDWFQRLEQRSR
jgi:predicted RNA-binding Zn-ribbon protein involved in translation (DUF1610 family)